MISKKEKRKRNLYITKEKTIKKLNITEKELIFYKNIGHIKYSEKTDKYDPDSILEKRTMTFGIEKFLNEEDKKEIIEKMEKYSSFKHKLVNDIQKEKEKYKNSGEERAHRKKGREYGFGTHISDSALASVTGLVTSLKTWYEKRIKELEKKIIQKEKELKNLIENINNKKLSEKFIKGKKKELHTLKNKLAKRQSKSYISIHFGKKYLNDKKLYRKSRLEYFSAGSATSKGNPEIRIEYSNNLKVYLLKIFNKYYKINIPNSHKSTFKLNYFNCQASRISFNEKGKLVLNITYSYIKPVEKRKIEKSKGSVGIDIGPKEIAVCFVKNDGNPLKYIHFPTGNLLDKRKKETKREISLILDKILDIATENEFLHITIENLELKEDYKYKSKKLNRMLKKFPHQIFEDLIEGKCSRRGIKLKKINPAYTSVIGIYKYSNRDNLSPKHTSKSKDLSAALAIGRRGLGFNECAIVCIKVFREIKSLKLRSLFPESEKDGKKFKGRGRSNWMLWNKLKRNYSLEQLTAELFVPKKRNSLLPVQEEISVLGIIEKEKE